MGNTPARGASNVNARPGRWVATGKETVSGEVGTKTRRENPAPRDEENHPPAPAPRVDDDEVEDEDAIPTYRTAWETSFGGVFGSFDDETTLGPMRYTYGPIPEDAVPCSALQVFSIRVADPKHGLGWPLHVYGLVAARDSADHNRNLLFRRTRDDCQTLTQNYPVLQLTGPSRAIVLADLVTFEVQLKVKGSKTEAEDEALALKVFDFHQGSESICTVPCNRCTLRFTFAPLLCSVQATISVKLVDGSWPDGHQGQVLSCTNGVDNLKTVLLDCRDGIMPIGEDGVFALSRRVLSVVLSGSGKLVVYVQARRVGLLTRAWAEFEPKRSGKSVGTCDLRFCKMEVTASWSLPYVPCHTNNAAK